MNNLWLLGALLAACAPFNLGGDLLGQGLAVTQTPNPTYTALAPYPTYTSLPTYTSIAVLESSTQEVVAPTLTPYATLAHYYTSTAVHLTHTPVSTSTPYFTNTPGITNTLVLTNTPDPATGTGTPSVTELPAASLWVEVVAYKTVLREIKQLNKKGYPIMRIREPRIRYDEGEFIEVYAFGGEDGGPLVRSDGLDYYYKVYDPDRIEEDLYVPSWHVEIVEGSVPTPETTTPMPTSDAIFLYVRVIATKTLLRVIESYNEDGSPVMVIREPRLRYDYGEMIPVYATGGEEGDYQYFYDGTVFYFRVFDSDGQEEELYVVSWQVELVAE